MSPPSTDPPPATPLRLGELLARLEAIRGELDREELELETQLELYREGCGHVAAAKRILDEVRDEVEMLAPEPDVIETGGG